MKNNNYSKHNQQPAQKEQEQHNKQHPHVPAQEKQQFPSNWPKKKDRS